MVLVGVKLLNKNLEIYTKTYDFSNKEFKWNYCFPVKEKGKNNGNYCERKN